MNRSLEKSPFSTAISKLLSTPVTLALMLLLGLLMTGCTTIQPQSFASADDAVTALTTALRNDDMVQIKKVFGSEGEDIINSGDEAADRNARAKFLSLYDEKHSLVADGEDSKTLVIGNGDWPFPVPIVKGEKGWAFDSDAGKEEILNRRIGRNELDAIQVCKAIGDAQKDYALLDPDKNGVHEYAQKFASDPGKRNGLYWPTAEGEEPSPLGELAAKASGEGYKRKEHGLTPYHGYYYRILTGQGPNAAGGELSYLVKGKMTLGFAIVAFPADYGNSGVMSFVMNADGVVYQKDLGKDTEDIALKMKAYDPDSTWKKAE